jgi:nucleoside-diphosphate-sugar epimerase
MKIMITGATGFIGRNLALGLHKDGHDVTATGRSAIAGNLLHTQGIDYHPADLLDPAALSDAFSPADCVIHCAGKSGDWGSYDEFFQVNVTGTQNLIAACDQSGTSRIVFLSSPSVYFNGSDRFDISESDPLPAIQMTDYARTKLVAETELLALAARGYRVIILRPRAVYGPYDTNLLPRILRMAEKKRFPLINGGQAMVDITYVDNLVDAVRRSLTAPDDAWNEVYNVSNGDPVTIYEWFARTLEALGKPFHPKSIPEPAAKVAAGLMELASRLPFGPKKPLMTRFSVGYMAKSMTMSLAKARQRLGYEPPVSNQESFERLALTAAAAVQTS